MQRDRSSTSKARLRFVAKKPQKEGKMLLRRCSGARGLAKKGPLETYSLYSCRAKTSKSIPSTRPTTQ
jgi:hypothetical protein